MDSYGDTQMKDKQGPYTYEPLQILVPTALYDYLRQA